MRPATIDLYQPSLDVIGWPPGNLISGFLEQRALSNCPGGPLDKSTHAAQTWAVQLGARTKLTALVCRAFPHGAVFLDLDQTSSLTAAFAVIVGGSYVRPG